MTESNTGKSVVTIGVDLGDEYSNCCVLDGEGAVVERARICTTAEALKMRFGGLPRTRIAVEAGTHSPWVSRLLKACGHEVLVANPRREGAIRLGFGYWDLGFSDRRNSLSKFSL